MRLVKGYLNLWYAGLTILLAGVVITAFGFIVVKEQSLSLSLLGVAGMALATFFTLWFLLRSLKGNQGKDEMNEIRLRVKEMAEMNSKKKP